MRKLAIYKFYKNLSQKELLGFVLQSENGKLIYEGKTPELREKIKELVEGIQKGISDGKPLFRWISKDVTVKVGGELIPFAHFDFWELYIDTRDPCLFKFLETAINRRYARYRIDDGRIFCKIEFSSTEEEQKYYDEMSKKMASLFYPILTPEELKREFGRDPHTEEFLEKIKDPEFVKSIKEKPSTKEWIEKVKEAWGWKEREELKK
jgi:hypothetical protein